MTELRKYSLVLAGFGLAAFLFSGCGSGELPTAVEQPQELFAVFAAQSPVLDGRGDDAVWQNSSAYRVFVDNSTGGANLPAQGLLMEFKAVWWKEARIDTVTGDTSDVYYVGFLATWPDADKSLERKTWSYDPAAANWSQGAQGSDWLLMYWIGFAKDQDLWFWDAALTNPMGYFQDMTLEGFQTGQTSTPYLVRVDGLNLFNDTAVNRKTWLSNYDDNKTPRDSTDDRPKFAWTNDPEMTAPGLLPVYSEASESRRFLLDTESAGLPASPYANPAKAVTVPSVVLQEPRGGAADIRSFGRHENGRWTVEFFRRATGSENSDVPFNPTARFFSQTFVVALGNNARSPFDEGAFPRLVNTTAVQLTFQFIRED